MRVRHKNKTKMLAREIIEKLIGGDIKLSQALQYSKLLMLDSKSRVHAEWVEKECDGYIDPLTLPSYRKYPCSLYSRNSVAYIGEHIKPVEAHYLDEQYKKETGLSLYTMYIKESIEFVETMYLELKENTIQMPFPEHIQTAFRESCNNSSVAILEVYQQAPASCLLGILSNAKNELINILLPLAKNEQRNELQEEMNSSNTRSDISAFISYSYDSHEHEEWVKHFVNTLKAQEINVFFDKDLPYGSNIPSFMVKSINAADVVLIIGTPIYLQKVENSATTGAKFEDVIITDSLMDAVETTKFIPILRKGTFKTSFSPMLKHRKGFNFSNDEAFDEQMKELLTKVFKRKNSEQ